jgi:hypothetical protein
MKPLVALILLLSTLTVAAEQSAAGDLYISVSLTSTERSKDSHSRTTAITISENKVVYDKTYRGYRRNRREPIHKEFKITEEETGRLKKIIKDHGLLVSDSLQYPSTGGEFVYFEISLKIRANKKESQIDISGPSKAAGITDEKIYKNSNALVEEIFRIINARDEDISYAGDRVLVEAQ